MLQWKSYEPAAGAVNVADFPASIVMSKLLPSFDVTVWVVVSLLVTVTVLPAFTGVVVNLKFAIVMPVVPPVSDFAAPLLPLLLHAESEMASPAMASRTLMRRMRELCMRNH